MLTTSDKICQKSKYICIKETLVLIYYDKVLLQINLSCFNKLENWTNINVTNMIFCSVGMMKKYWRNVERKIILKEKRSSEKKNVDYIENLLHFQHLSPHTRAHFIIWFSLIYCWFSLPSLSSLYSSLHFSFSVCQQAMHNISLGTCGRQPKMYYVLKISTNTVMHPRAASMHYIKGTFHYLYTHFSDGLWLLARLCVFITMETTIRHTSPT